MSSSTRRSGRGATSSKTAAGGQGNPKPKSVSERISKLALPKHPTSSSSLSTRSAGSSRPSSSRTRSADTSPKGKKRGSEQKTNSKPLGVSSSRSPASSRGKGHVRSQTSMQSSRRTPKISGIPSPRGSKPTRKASPRLGRTTSGDKKNRLTSKTTKHARSTTSLMVPTSNASSTMRLSPSSTQRKMGGTGSKGTKPKHKRSASSMPSSPSSSVSKTKSPPSASSSSKPSSRVSSTLTAPTAGSQRKTPIASGQRKHRRTASHMPLSSTATKSKRSPTTSTAASRLKKHTRNASTMPLRTNRSPTARTAPTSKGRAQNKASASRGATSSTSSSRSARDAALKKMVLGKGRGGRKKGATKTAAKTSTAGLLRHMSKSARQLARNSLPLTSLPEIDENSGPSIDDVAKAPHSTGPGKVGAPDAKAKGKVKSAWTLTTTQTASLQQGAMGAAFGGVTRQRRLSRDTSSLPSSRPRGHSRSATTLFNVKWGDNISPASVATHQDEMTRTFAAKDELEYGDIWDKRDPDSIFPYMLRAKVDQRIEAFTPIERPDEEKILRFAVSHRKSPLPKGLLLNPMTGEISGKPRVACSEKDCEIMASRENSRSYYVLKVEVVPLHPPTVRYPPAVGVRGRKLSVMPGIIKGPVEKYKLAPFSEPLPNGLSLNETTGEVSGVPTAELAKRTYDIESCNRAGRYICRISMQIKSALNTKKVWARVRRKFKILMAFRNVTSTARMLQVLARPIAAPQEVLQDPQTALDAAVATIFEEEDDVADSTDNKDSKDAKPKLKFKPKSVTFQLGLPANLEPVVVNGPLQKFSVSSKGKPLPDGLSVSAQGCIVGVPGSVCTRVRVVIKAESVATGKSCRGECIISVKRPLAEL